jgi:hypothetical protein
MPAKEQLLPDQKPSLAKVQRKDSPGVKTAPSQSTLPIDPGNAPRTAGQVIRLQQSVGNRAVGQLIQEKARSGAIQTKLTVGPAGDAYEQEADRVAAQVMNTPAPAEKAQRAAEEEEEIQMKRLIQRDAAPEEEELQTKPILQRAAEEDELMAKPLVQRQEDEEEIQTKRLIQRSGLEEEEIQTKSLIQRAADGSFEAGADVENRLESQQGGGSPLPAETRSFMEPRFGADFGSVRMHTDDGAAQLSQDLNAQAFTKGTDIYMGAGKYNPDTSSGKELLAHELTHVVQQGGAPLKEENKAE